VKKLFLPLSLFFIASQGQSQQVSGIDSPRLVVDTSKVKDSLGIQKPLTLHDPKKDFKDLFVNSSVITGVNTAQLNPRAISFVQDYMQKQSKKLYNMKGWARPYFDMIDVVLKQHGLPGELKYLSVIESDMKSLAVSWAGAVGPWQFMPETGRRMGLKISRQIDERTDYYKSTHAAAKYLTELYSIYGDWLLVIAAYNGGPGSVNNAIKRSGSKDFWNLQNYLPTESRNHVKKFIATHYIMEGQGGLTTLTKDETKNFLFITDVDGVQKPRVPAEEITGVKKLTISGKYNSLVITKFILMDIAEFNRLNPDFDNRIATMGNYDIRLAPDKMDLFLANKFKILNESVQVLLNAGN
jgi:peptidoglycan lytic transglycosylase D